MRKLGSILFAVLGVICVLGVALAAQAKLAATSQFVVILKKGNDPKRIAEEYGIRPTFCFRNKLKAFVGAIESSRVSGLRQDPRIRSIDPENESPVIVSLKRSVNVDGFVREHLLSPTHRYTYALKGFALRAGSEILQQLDQDKRVSAVEYDGQVSLTPGSTNSTIVIPAGSIPSQIIPNGLKRMGIDHFPIPHIGRAGPPLQVDVAILDTGIQIDTTAMDPLPSTGSHAAHPDLNVVHAAGFADPGLNGDDWTGHGTHVAGIIGALDNAIGSVGVVPGARLWSVQVVGPNERNVSNLLAGMDYVALHADEISVVNASLSVPAGSSYEALHEAVQSIVNRGVIFVTGTGNNGSDISVDLFWGDEDDLLPAAFPEVMAVSAIDSNPMEIDPANPLVPGTTPNAGYDRFWYFSNFSYIAHDPALVQAPGFGIDLAAPGINVFSTYKNGDYALMSGTSMASPHAAGLAALYILANGRCHNAQEVYKVRQALIDMGQPQSDWSTHGDTDDGDPNHEPLAIANEAWVPRPKFLSSQLTPSGFLLQYTSVPGYYYTVQTADLANSDAGAWHNLGSPVQGTGGLLTALDSNPPFGSRVYRVQRSTP